MDARTDAQLRLAAQRHPARSGSSGAGSLHFAQHQLGEVTKAFIVLMAEAGHPGAHPFPPPSGRSRWPRNHQARNCSGWLVPVAADAPFESWVDVGGQWWMLRLAPDGGALDAHPVGTPMRQVSDLSRYAAALDRLLDTYDLLS